jgi:hypothetical protein
MEHHLVDVIALSWTAFCLCLGHYTGKKVAYREMDTKDRRCR